MSVGEQGGWGNCLYHLPLSLPLTPTGPWPYHPLLPTPPYCQEQQFLPILILSDLSATSHTDNCDEHTLLISHLRPCTLWLSSDLPGHSFSATLQKADMPPRPLVCVPCFASAWTSPGESTVVVGRGLVLDLYFLQQAKLAKA